MSDNLAIIACAGVLPVLIAKHHPEALCFGLKGVPNDLENDVDVHQIEKIGGLFAAMKDQGVERVVLAGSLTRPPLNPADFDPVIMGFAPRLLGALQAGDDALLRQVIGFFEEQGFTMLGAHELVPELTAEEGLHIGPEIGKANVADVARAQEILTALSPLDVGQGCVVGNGQCLGVETLQGTDALLRFVAETDEARHAKGGVLVKAPKQGQDLRVDMPAIGPKTIQAVKNARLDGIVIEAGRVMILEREKTLDAVNDTGIFLSAQRF
ncbi:LpxI family protein [Roseovarius sp. EL26]|uniref:LpxI family protein n=1 Tax=Roseovarius sp. EL26 TaxID=2126672 RepID=UPI000EA1262B|nr:UDP-2,3-diacylglucosamine diphosphatase LpxI [Roseovarius sp. EL26]